MIVGLGTDIVEIARIEHLWKRQGLKFAQRLLTAPELQELEQSAQPVHFLAKRWAAKEALAKALGTGIAQGVSFQDMTVVHNAQGQPTWEVTGETLRFMEEKNAGAYLSISDEQHYALATVILESKG
jgi:holo-[acyl-carrier protein] synthase